MLKRDEWLFTVRTEKRPDPKKRKEDMLAMSDRGQDEGDDTKSQLVL